MAIVMDIRPNKIKIPRYHPCTNTIQYSMNNIFPMTYNLSEWIQVAMLISDQIQLQD